MSYFKIFLKGQLKIIGYPKSDKARKLYEKMKNLIRIDKNIEDITPLNLHADVSVTDYSSVLYEFMITNKPSIQLSNIHSKKLFFEGTMKTSLENLPNTINKLMDDSSEYFYEQRKQISKRVFKPDGHTSERVVVIIKKLLEG